mgnify:CR=1 FL=1
MFVVTREPLDAAKLVEAVCRDESGAVVLFYDAYEAMAEKKLRDVGAETKRRFPIDDIAIAHRVGRLDIGETSLLVAVSSAHRADAFEAAHYCVDRIKQVVPIWKKEVWEDGSAWLEGHPVDLPEPASHP